MTDLALTADQSLRLHLLGLCLPVAGAQAVDMATHAYAFVAHTDAATIPDQVAAPTLAPPDASVVAEPPTALTATVPETAPHPVPSTDGLAREILEVIAAHPRGISPGRVADAVGCSLGTFRASIRPYVESGVVAATGTTTQRRYHLTEAGRAAAWMADIPPPPDDLPPTQDAPPANVPPADDPATTLRRLMDEGLHVPRIALRMGITQGEVVDLMALNGWAGIDRQGRPCSPNGGSAVHMQERPAQRRSCMRCGAEFISMGPHHRMCSTCRALPEGA